jgi:hypothetical protein
VYNKLFTKILDSSVWLAPDPHRLIWITLIAAMDEDGNAMFACAENLAARARVSVKQAETAILAFESPDPKSGDPENEGRRIERFPGGWRVLNAHKYRAMVTRAIIREQTRQRTAKWRATKRGDASVTQSDESVTPSEALALSGSPSPKKIGARSARGHRLPEDFSLTPERKAVAEAEKLDPDRIFADFRDYWTAASGAKARKCDWDATWRVWCRNQFSKSNGPAKRRLTRYEEIFGEQNVKEV